MTFQTDCNDVRQILHYFEERLCENEAADDIRMDFNQLICLLDSPLFARLANVEDALTTLSDISRIHAITETDFDIDVDSGEIRFSNRHSKKLNNQGLQQHVGSDNYHEEKQNNNQVRKKHMIPQHPGEGEIELIELQKPEGQGIGLGFGIVGLSSVTQELGVIVHEIQPGSIAARDGRLRENDKILAINGQALNETAPLSQAVQLLQAVTGKVALIVAHETRPELEQSISVTEQSMAMSPLSVASESIFSCDYIQLEVIDLYNDGSGLGFGIISGRGCGVLIKTIVPNGISDKDGRLRSGDRILMIGDVDVRNMNTEGVATELRQSSVHVRLVVARNLGSLPPPAPHGGNNDTLKVTVLASQLDEELEKLKRKAVAAAEEDSQVASEKGDDLDTLPQISSLTMPSDVLPEVDVFEVELTKDQSGLGITIAGYNDPNDGVPHIFVNEIADGSVAALDGRIRLFDRIIQVDGHALKGCDNQKALDVFRKTGQVVHLKIARPKIGAHFEPVSRRSVVSDSRPTSRVESVYMNTNSDAPPDDARGSADDDAVAYWQSVFGPGYQIIVANLVKPKPSIQLGISLEGIIDKETGVVHHIVRSILPDGVVGSSGLILSDDELVEVNGIKLYGLSHSEIVHVLRELPAEVCLIVARGTQTSVASEYFSVEQSVTSQLSSTPPVAPPPVDINRTKHTVATPIIDRLVKAKSEQALFNPSPAVTPLNQNRSKSLDSLAMFGLWSSDPVEVELEKGDQGLGFSILDYPDTLDPNKTMIIVRGLVPDGTAYRDGRLQPGDRLVSVNDISLFNASLDMAVQSLVGAPKGIIRLTVLKQERFGSSNTDVDQEMTSWSSPAEEVTSSPDRVNDTRQSVKQHAITVTGSSGKLGVTVESLLDKGQRGCVVTSLDPDGRLAQDGQLAVGDVILSINKDDVRDVSSVQARAILRRLSLIGTSDLTIVFTRNESNQIESRTPDLLSQVSVKDQNNEDSFKSNTQQSPSVLSPLSLPLLSVADPDDQFSAGVKSAMSSISNWGPSHVVEIFRKEGESLGISIVGGHIKQLPGSAGESGKVFSGIFIKHIRPDSPAGRNGIIQTGDHILEVNGVDLRDVTHDQAVDAIRNAASPIRFLVRSLVSVPGMTVEPEAIPVATHPSALKKALPVTGSTSSDGSDEYDDDDDPGLQQQLSPLPDLHSDDEQHASDLSTLKLPRLSPVDDGYLAAGRISPSHGTTTESVETESLDNVAVFSLTKGDRGFGFAIEELPLKDGSRGIFVKTISPDGPAAEEGTLSVGDRLLKVDDVSLHHATYSEALLALRQFNFGSAARLTVNKASLDGSDLHDTSSLGSDNGSTPAASSVSPSHRMPAVTLTPADDKPTISTPAEVAAAAVADDPATREIVPGRETTIEIQKGKTGLGLSIIGGSDTLLGAIVVHEVYENGAAARDGRLWAGDQILEVCGESLRSTTHERAIQILRQTPSVVKLVVLREVEVLSDGEMYETISVDLVKKRNAGLGFSIVNRPSGVFISDLVRGGVAESDGRLMPGDHIISLNGTDVTDATQEQIAEFLRTSTGVVSIAVRRLKPGKDGPTSIAGVNYQSSSSSRNGLDLPMALHEKAKSGSSAASSSSPPADQKAGDDDVSTIAVELSRHERGLLMLKLAPEQTATGSPSKGHLIIVDLHGTGKAIGDKLQVYDKILSINGHSTRGMSERDACQLIQASGDSVVMIIVRGQQTFSSSTTAATKSASGVSVDEPDDASQYSESVRRITIRRGAHGFGFSIVGGRDEKMGNIPIYIKQVFPGGPADVDGRLKRGDQLLTVNGKSLEGFTHEQAVEALKNASGNIVFTVVG